MTYRSQEEEDYLRQLEGYDFKIPDEDQDTNALKDYKFSIDKIDEIMEQLEEEEKKKKKELAEYSFEGLEDKEKKEEREKEEKKKINNNIKKAQEIRLIARDNGDGSVSSVLMESGEQDGKFIAYPTLFPKDKNNYTQNPEDWIELESDEAIKEARKRGEIFEFDTNEEAEEFAEGSWKPEESETVSEVQVPSWSQPDKITRNAWLDDLEEEYSNLPEQRKFEASDKTKAGMAGLDDQIDQLYSSLISKVNETERREVINKINNLREEKKRLLTIDYVGFAQPMLETIMEGNEEAYLDPNRQDQIHDDFKSQNPQIRNYEIELAMQVYIARNEREHYYQEGLDIIVPSPLSEKGAKEYVSKKAEEQGMLFLNKNDQQIARLVLLIEDEFQKAHLTHDEKIAYFLTGDHSNKLGKVDFSNIAKWTEELKELGVKPEDQWADLKTGMIPVDKTRDPHGMSKTKNIMRSGTAADDQEEYDRIVNNFMEDIMRSTDRENYQAVNDKNFAIVEFLKSELAKEYENIERIRLEDPSRYEKSIIDIGYYYDKPESEKSLLIKDKLRTANQLYEASSRLYLLNLEPGSEEKTPLEKFKSVLKGVVSTWGGQEFADKVFGSTVEERNQATTQLMYAEPDTYKFTEKQKDNLQFTFNDRLRVGTGHTLGIVTMFLATGAIGRVFGIPQYLKLLKGGNKVQQVLGVAGDLTWADMQFQVMGMPAGEGALFHTSMSVLNKIPGGKWLERLNSIILRSTAVMLKADVSLMAAGYSLDLFNAVKQDLMSDKTFMEAIKERFGEDWDVEMIVAAITGLIFGVGPAIHAHQGNIREIKSYTEKLTRFEKQLRNADMHGEADYINEFRMAFQEGSMKTYKYKAKAKDVLTEESFEKIARIEIEQLKRKYAEGKYTKEQVVERIANIGLTYYQNIGKIPPKKKPIWMTEESLKEEPLLIEEKPKKGPTDETKPPLDTEPSWMQKKPTEATRKLPDKEKHDRLISDIETYKILLAEEQRKANPSEERIMELKGVVADLESYAKQVEPEKTEPKEPTIQSKVKILPYKDVYSSKDGVNTMRIKGTNKHYGNPFAVQDIKGTIKTPDIPTAVKAYEDWLEGIDKPLSDYGVKETDKTLQQIEPERRQWILDQIDSGKLDNVDLLYYKAGYRSHADALLDIIKERKTAKPKAEIEEILKVDRALKKGIIEKAEKETGLFHTVIGKEKDPLQRVIPAAGTSNYNESEASKNLTIGDILDIRYLPRRDFNQIQKKRYSEEAEEYYHHFLNLTKDGIPVGSVTYKSQEDLRIINLLREGKEVKVVVTRKSPNGFFEYQVLSEGKEVEKPAEKKKPKLLTDGKKVELSESAEFKVEQEGPQPVIIDKENGNVWIRGINGKYLVYNNNELVATDQVPGIPVRGISEAEGIEIDEHIEKMQKAIDEEWGKSEKPILGYDFAKSVEQSLKNNKTGRDRLHEIFKLWMTDAALAEGRPKPTDKQIKDILDVVIPTDRHADLIKARLRMYPTDANASITPAKNAGYITMNQWARELAFILSENDTDYGEMWHRNIYGTRPSMTQNATEMFVLNTMKVHVNRYKGKDFNGIKEISKLIKNPDVLDAEAYIVYKQLGFSDRYIKQLIESGVHEEVKRENLIESELTDPDKIVAKAMQIMEMRIHADIEKALQENFKELLGKDWPGWGTAYSIFDMFLARDGFFIGADSRIERNQRLQFPDQPYRNLMANRIIALGHEVGHVIHAVNFGTKAEKEMYDAFMAIYNTEFGKKFIDSIIDSTHPTSRKYAEFITQVWSIALHGSKFLEEYQKSIEGVKHIKGAKGRMGIDAVYEYMLEVAKTGKATDLATFIRKTKNSYGENSQAVHGFMNKLAMFIRNTLKRIKEIANEFMNKIIGKEIVKEDPHEAKKHLQTIVRAYDQMKNNIPADYISNAKEFVKFYYDRTGGPTEITMAKERDAKFFETNKEQTINELAEVVEKLADRGIDSKKEMKEVLKHVIRGSTGARELQKFIDRNINAILKKADFVETDHKTLISRGGKLEEAVEDIEKGKLVDINDNSSGRLVEHLESDKAFHDTQETRIEAQRSIFRKLMNYINENTDMVNGERAIFRLTQNPEFEQSLTNRSTFKSFLLDVARTNPQLAEILGNNELITFEEIISLSNFYGSMNLMKAIYLSQKDNGDIDIRNLNQSDRLTLFSNLIKESLKSFTYRNDINPNTAIEQAYNEYFRADSKLRELQEIYKNDPEELQQEVIRLSSEYLALITGIGQRVWKGYFNTKNEKMFFDGEAGIPGIIAGMKAKRGPFEQKDKLQAMYNYLFDKPVARKTESNIVKLLNTAVDEDAIAFSYTNVVGNRDVSFELASNLHRSAKNIKQLSKGDAYKTNELAQWYAENNEEINIVKLGGAKNEETKKDSEAIDLSNIDFATFLAALFFKGNETYLQYLGQFADKKQAYTIKVKRYKDAEARYRKVYLNATPEQHVHMDDPKSITDEFLLENFDEMFRSNAVFGPLRTTAEGRIKLARDYFFNYSLNMFWALEIFHGNLGQYLDYKKFIKLSGQTNSPGFVPNLYVDGGIGRYRQHVVINDLLDENGLPYFDGILFMLQKDFATPLQVSMGSVFSQAEKYPLLDSSKALYSETRPDGLRVVDKGNMAVIDNLAKRFPGSIFEKLMKYMNDHQIQTLSFYPSTTKLESEEVTQLFKNNSFTNTNPVIHTRDNANLFIQHDLRSTTKPQVRKLPKTVFANLLHLGVSDEIIKLFDEFNKIQVDEVGKYTDETWQEKILEGINRNQLPELYDYIKAGGDHRHPIFDVLIKMIKTSVLEKSAFQQNVYRVALQEIPDPENLCRSMRKVKLPDGKIVVSLATVYGNIEGVRKTSDSNKYKSLKAALLVAKQYPDMLDRNGEVRHWEIIETMVDGKKRYVIPGGFTFLTRVPSDALHSHILARLEGDIPGAGNVIMTSHQVAIISSSDFDGDERYVMVFAKGKHQKILRYIESQLFDKDGKVISTTYADLSPEDKKGAIMNEALLYIAEAWYDPNNFDIINEKIDITKYDQTLKNLGSRTQFKLTSPVDGIKIRNNIISARKAIGLHTNLSTTFSFIRKAGINIYEFDTINFASLPSRDSFLLSSPEIIADLSSFTEDKFNILKNHFGNITNMLMDNRKDPKTEELGINEETDKIFSYLLISNPSLDLAKTAKEYDERVVKWIDYIASWLNSPMLRDYIQLSRERKRIGVDPDNVRIKSVFEKLRVKYKKDKGADVNTLEKIHYMGEALNKIYEFIKLTREVPNTPGKLYEAQTLIANIKTNRMQFDVSNFLENRELSQLVRSAERSYNAGLTKVFGDAFDSSTIMEMVIHDLGYEEVASKNKGMLKHLQGSDYTSFVGRETMDFIVKEAKRILSVMALARGKTLLEVEDNLKDFMLKNSENEFIKHIQLVRYNLWDKEQRTYIQILDNYKKRSLEDNLLVEVHEAFDELPDKIQEQFIAYSIMRYGLSIGSFTGNYTKLFSNNAHIKLGNVMANIADITSYNSKFNSRLIGPQNLKDLIVMFNPELDHTNKFKTKKPMYIVDPNMPTVLADKLMDKALKAIKLGADDDQVTNVMDLFIKNQNDPLKTKIYNHWKSDYTRHYGEDMNFSEYVQGKKSFWKGIVEMLERMKIKGLLFDAVLGLPVAVWNGLLSSVQLSIESGVKLDKAINNALKKIFEENKTLRKEILRDKSFDQYVNEVRDHIETDLKIMESRADLGKWKDRFYEISSSNAFEAFKKLFGPEMSNISLSSFFEYVNKKPLPEKYLLQNGFTQKEIDKLSTHMKIMYYYHDKGTVPHEDVLYVAIDENRDISHVHPLPKRENTYIETWGIKNMTVKAKPLLNKIHRRMSGDLPDKYEDAATEEYRLYLRATDMTRQAAILLSGIKNYDALSEKDINTLEVAINMLDNLDPLATKEVLGFAKQVLGMYYWKTMVEFEVKNPQPGIPKLAMIAAHDLIRDKGVQDIKTHFLASIRLLLILRREFSKDLPLMQLHSREMDYQHRHIVNDQNTFNKDMADVEPKIKHLKIDQVTRIPEYDPKTRLMIPPRSLNFPVFFGRKIGKAELNKWKNLRSRIGKPSYKKSLEEGLDKSDVEMFHAYHDFYKMVMRALKAYHPSYKYVTDDISVPFPTTFMSFGEAVSRYGIKNALYPGKSNIYMAFRPTKYDRIRLKSGKTFGMEKARIAKALKAGTISEDKAFSEIVKLRRIAKVRYKRGTVDQGLQVIFSDIKSVPGAYFGGNDLPFEFQSEKLVPSIAKMIRTLITSYHRKQYEPLAMVLLHEHKGLKKSGKLFKYFERDTNYQTYGESPDSEKNQLFNNILKWLTTITALIVLPLNPKAFYGNYIAGMFMDSINAPITFLKGLFKIHRDILYDGAVELRPFKSFKKARNIMRKKEIANIVEEVEYDRHLKWLRKGGSIAFWSTEIAEMLIQTPLFRGEMKKKVWNAYDLDGNEKTTKEFIDGQYVKIEDKNAMSVPKIEDVRQWLQGIHGSYGWSRAHYSYYQIGRTVGQFFLPWAYAQALKVWGKENTDYRGNFSIGMIRGMARELQILAYNISPQSKAFVNVFPNKGEWYLKKIEKAKTDDREFKNLPVVDQLIIQANAGKIKWANAPEEIKNSHWRSAILGGIIIGLWYFQQFVADKLQSLLFHEVEIDGNITGYKKKSIDELTSEELWAVWRYKKLQYMLEIATNDILIPFDPTGLVTGLITEKETVGFWEQKIYKGPALTMMIKKVVEEGENIITGDRYETYSDKYIKGQLKWVDNILKLTPGIASPYKFGLENYRSFTYAKDLEKLINAGKSDIIEDMTFYAAAVRAIDGENITKELEEMFGGEANYGAEGFIRTKAMYMDAANYAAGFRKEATKEIMLEKAMIKYVLMNLDEFYPKDVARRIERNIIKWTAENKQEFIKQRGAIYGFTGEELKELIQEEEEMEEEPPEKFREKNEKY